MGTANTAITMKICLLLLASIVANALADDDSYVTLVKGYIDAGTCDTVSSNDNCGDDATSYYNLFTYNGKYVVISSQVPDHDAESDQLNDNGNSHQPLKGHHADINLHGHRRTGRDWRSL